MIWVNGRFSTQPLSGIQRYAFELVTRIDPHRIVVPNVPTSEYAGLDGSVVQVARSRLPHHAWEQFVLPAVLPRDALLWNPAGSGPVRNARHQVLTIHDVSVFDCPEGFNVAYLGVYRTLYSVLPKRVHRLLAVSEFTRRRVVEVFGVSEKRVGVVPNAPARQFRPLERSSVDDTLRRLGVQRPYVFTLGAVSARKNFGRLMNAWATIQAQWPEHRLVIIGSSGLAFADRTRLGPLPERTVMMGHLPDQDVVALYCGADIVAYPSLYEGFGLPVIEAMACGTPVLTSNTSAMPEVAGDAALLVNPYSVEAIAAGLDTLLRDKGLRRELAHRGRRRAAEFSWEHAAKRLAEELEL